MTFATLHSKNLPINRIFTRIIILSVLLAAFHTMPVLADNYSDVGKLTQSGHYGEALAKANAYLVQQPRDAQMRFLKGLILTEQNKSAEAISVFTKLTEDFPRLPEPYNNLAVLFAATNQYEKSRAALEMAIRTNPTYATAHENLGDVYAKLASQAYDKALQLDTTNSGAKSKLTLIHTLVNGVPTGASGKNPVVTILAAKPITPPNIPSIIEKSVAIRPPVKTEALSKAPPSPKIATNLTPERAKPVIPVKSSENGELKLEHKDNAETSSIINVVNKWASAWGDQDMKSYLAAYSKNFEPEQNMSNKAWSDQRHARIEGKNRISVKISSPEVTITGNSAAVKFRQSYKSNNYSSNSNKILLMTKQFGKWQIKQEQSGN